MHRHNYWIYDILLSRFLLSINQNEHTRYFCTLYWIHFVLSIESMCLHLFPNEWTPLLLQIYGASCGSTEGKVRKLKPVKSPSVPCGNTVPLAVPRFIPGISVFSTQSMPNAPLFSAGGYITVRLSYDIFIKGHVIFSTCTCGPSWPLRLVRKTYSPYTPMDPGGRYSLKEPVEL